MYINFAFVLTKNTLQKYKEVSKKPKKLQDFMQKTAVLALRTAVE